LDEIKKNSTLAINTKLTVHAGNELHTVCMYLFKVRVLTAVLFYNKIKKINKVIAEKTIHSVALFYKNQPA
jgi:hypothetical protein